RRWTGREQDANRTGTGREQGFQAQFVFLSSRARGVSVGRRAVAASKGAFRAWGRPPRRPPASRFAMQPGEHSGRARAARNDRKGAQWLDRQRREWRPPVSTAGAEVSMHFQLIAGRTKNVPTWERSGRRKHGKSSHVETIRSAPTPGDEMLRSG